jgi:hypothetical protein
MRNINSLGFLLTFQRKTRWVKMRIFNEYYILYTHCIGQQRLLSDQVLGAKPAFQRNVEEARFFLSIDQFVTANTSLPWVTVVHKHNKIDDDTLKVFKMHIYLLALEKIFHWQSYRWLLINNNKVLYKFLGLHCTFPKFL